MPRPSARALAYDTTCAGRQAEEAERRQQQVVAVAGVPQREAAEDRRVADPVQGGVEEGAPAAGPPGIRAIVPSTRSEKTKQRDDDRAPEELAARVEHQRAGDDTEGADQGDDVRADAPADAGSRRSA